MFNWRSAERGRTRASVRGVGLIAACALALTVVACGGSSTDSSTGTSAGAATEGSAEKARVVLMNNFMGNSWRPVMMRSAELLAEVPPLDAHVEDLKLVVTDNSAAAQNAALNSALLDKPDLILIDAANATASNQTIEKVCKAGVVVVSFDVNVTAPCAWKIGIDFHDMGTVAGKWMAETIGGEGTVFLDLGQAGAQSAADWADGAKEALADYPDINIKTYYGEFSEGAEQAAVANLVATNPDVKGLLTHGYGPPAQRALKKAGKDYVPMTGFAYAGTVNFCAENPTVPCLIRSSPSWVSGSAMQLGLDVISGKEQGPARFVTLAAPWFASGDVTPDTKDEVIAVSDGAEPSLNPGLMLPLSPSWAQLDTEEVLQKPNVG